MYHSSKSIFSFVKQASLIALVALVEVGCKQHPTQYAVESSFGLGTNAVININRTLPIGGYYEFVFEFLQVDRDRLKAEKWPLEMDASIHLLVKTNGQTVMDTNISKLEFSYVSDKRKVAAYSSCPGGFLVTADNVAMECILEDRGDEPKHPVHLILFNTIAK